MSSTDCAIEARQLVKTYAVRGGKPGIRALDEATATHQEGLDAMEAQLPRLFLIESEYQLALRRAEAEWVRGLLTELTDGTFPGLKAWRHYHETGVFPAELIPSLNQEGEPAADS